MGFGLNAGEQCISHLYPTIQFTGLRGTGVWHSICSRLAQKSNLSGMQEIVTSFVNMIFAQIIKLCAWLCVSVCLAATFTGTDHLQHHLCSPAVVQTRLLVQKPLFLHLLVLWREEGHSCNPANGDCTAPRTHSLTHSLTFAHCDHPTAAHRDTADGAEADSVHFRLVSVSIPWWLQL